MDSDAEQIIRQWLAFRIEPQYANSRPVDVGHLPTGSAPADRWMNGYRARLRALVKEAESHLVDLRSETASPADDVILPPPVAEEELSGFLFALGDTLDNDSMTPRWADAGESNLDEQQVPVGIQITFRLLYREQWTREERDSLMKRLTIGSLTDLEIRSGRARAGAEAGPVSWEALTSVWEHDGVATYA